MSRDEQRKFMTLGKEATKAYYEELAKKYNIKRKK
jgi:hypothetical protein